MITTTTTKNDVWNFDLNNEYEYMYPYLIISNQDCRDQTKEKDGCYPNELYYIF